jgi:hypothetical protein
MARYFAHWRVRKFNRRERKERKNRRRNFNHKDHIE